MLSFLHENLTVPFVLLYNLMRDVTPKVVAYFSPQSFILFITDYTDYFFVFYHMVNYKISGICGEKTSFYEAGSIVLRAIKRRLSLFVLQIYNIL